MSVDLVFKKYFYAIVLFLVVLAAYFQASGVSYLVAAQYAVGSSPPPPLLPQAQGETMNRPHVAPILDRNPFDSVTGSLNAPPPSETEVPAEAAFPDDPLTVPVCGGVVVFILTESTDPLWSFAALQAPGETGATLRRVGDPIGGKKVAYIGYNPATGSPTVWLEGDGICQAPLFPSGEGPVAPVAAAAPPTGEAEPPASSASSGSAISPEIKAKIKQISETEFEIDRSAVETILADPSQMMKAARIVPETVDGKTVGIRLFGVRPDTLFGNLGLKNGDRLEQINGHEMASPEKALEAYARLRTAENLKIQINRRGQPMTLVLTIK